MANITLLAWDRAEEWAGALRAAGHTVAGSPPRGELWRDLVAHPPHIFVVDLTVRPSHGREMAAFLSQHRATRHLPIVALGPPEAVRGPLAQHQPLTITLPEEIAHAVDQALSGGQPSLGASQP